METWLLFSWPPQNGVCLLPEIDEHVRRLKVLENEAATNHFTYAGLEENDADLKKLQGWLDKIRKLDFYGAALANEAAACCPLNRVQTIRQ
jgi:hypothetical protein